MTTSRAGGLHKLPWGIPHAEPIGSSNNPPLAVVAPPPQIWQLFLSLPCVKGGGTACRDGGIVLLCFATSTIPQSLRDSSLYTREPPLRRELCKAKAFWNHQHCWWFSFNKDVTTVASSFLVVTLYKSYSPCTFFCTRAFFILVNINFQDLSRRTQVPI